MVYQNTYSHKMDNIFNFSVVVAVLLCQVISPTSAIPSITASFVTSPVDNEDSASLICTAYELGNQGNYYVAIDRTRSSRVEPLFVNTEYITREDNIRVFVSSDEPKEYRLSITGVYYLFDTGTYTCSIHDLSKNVVSSASATLDINHLPAEFNPRCSINGFNKDLSRNTGDEVVLGCHSDFGYPMVNAPVWSYSACDGSTTRTLPDAQLTQTGAYYSELIVTLTGDDNGGRFICSINRPDVGFNKNCTYGTFVIPDGTVCDVAMETTGGPSTTSATSVPSTTSTSDATRVTMVTNKTLIILACIAYIVSFNYEA